MGSAASWGNREQTSPDTAEALISHEEWERQGREMLSRLLIIPQVQRKRAESVGYPTQNGIYWVYWRPKEARQQAAGGKTGNQGVIQETLCPRPANLFLSLLFNKCAENDSPSLCLQCICRCVSIRIFIFLVTTIQIMGRLCHVRPIYSLIFLCITIFLLR